MEDMIPYDAEGFGKDLGGVEVWLMLDKIVAPLIGVSAIV